MVDYEVGPPPNANEYVSFQLYGGPHDSEWVRLPWDTKWYECLDDDGWVVRYERDTYDFGSGHKRTVFGYTGLPRKDGTQP